MKKETHSKIVSNSLIVITPYIHFISESMNYITIKDYDSQQDKYQNEDFSFSITENMKNMSVLDDILDCDYDSEMEEDEDEKDDSKYWKTFTNDNNEEIKIFFFTSDEQNRNSSCILSRAVYLKVSLMNIKRS
jgi:hypothetical protein